MMSACRTISAESHGPVLARSTVWLSPDRRATDLSNLDAHPPSAIRRGARSHHQGSRFATSWVRIPVTHVVRKAGEATRPAKVVDARQHHALLEALHVEHLHLDHEPPPARVRGRDAGAQRG